MEFDSTEPVWFADSPFEVLSGVRLGGDTSSVDISTSTASPSTGTLGSIMSSIRTRFASLPTPSRSNVLEMGFAISDGGLVFSACFV